MIPTHFRPPFLCLLALAFVSIANAQEAVTLFPTKIHLRGKSDRQRVIVSSKAGNADADRTPQAKFTVADPKVAQVDEQGVVTPTGSGSTEMVADFEGKKATAKITVEQGDRFLPVTFEKDVEPILARAGCNSGPCHGKSRGQNGFQLSLLGYDPDYDYQALTAENRGRRIFPANPEMSLLLRKGAGLVPHGGGRRLMPGDRDYETILAWLNAGMPRTPADEPHLLRITVEPSERLLTPKSEQQLVVTGHYSDGSARDVTHLAMYQSNESVIASVAGEGRVKAGPLPGEAAIMARFMEKFAVCNVLIPLPGSVPGDTYAKLPRKNTVDNLVWAKLQKLGITPSGVCDDTTFLRRAHLDVIGRLPTPDEVKTFLADLSPNKREKLVDHLLARPEYADFWANKWADLLRPNPYRVGIKAVFSLDSWLRDAFRRNMPYDQFVREVLTAQGSTYENGATVVFRDRREPDEITTMVSQVFLGIRLECAKCHHHPFEIWSQDDFYSFAAHFARIGRRGTGLSPPISGSEEAIFTAKSGQVKHPVTGKVLEPRPLLGTATPIKAGDDPRRALAEWITKADSQAFFAKVMVNRVWADLMGKGIVEPIDDLRASNPPSNGPLLDHLTEQFRKDGYDLKKLLKTILNSQVYQLASTPTDRNTSDLRNYSRHYRQRLRAEVLLDAVSDIVGVPETFAAMPPKSRAMELWTVRSQSIFLDSFGRPDPNQDPPCERTSDTTVVQALHLMNSNALHGKITNDLSRAAQLAASKMAPGEIVDELYLRVFARYPKEREKQYAVSLFHGPNITRRQAVEDLMWSLLNAAEFVFKD